ncbi:hypothetical protein SAMN04487846_0796 [Microbacterium sp. cf046]|uniref:hypothetical protein n=1 Tax=Microbacterium sp. cf046 TaxID=1761803 RepID=UPI0008F15EB6|nr:hypothetical protein [Microbacterium sp. cf046]SFR93409.1 hypothetical protein SAMN04487846_0796 [Microbacterium sp. cf046]
MTTESAIFTAIPAGRMPDQGLLKVTVFVTPRLSTDEPPGSGVLIELPAFAAFANWPKTLADAKWGIEVDGVGTIDGIPFTDVDPDAVTPSPDVWSQLFDRTSVGEANFQHFEQAVVHSYSVDEVAKAITGLYQTIAVTSPTSFPAITRGPLAGKLEELRSPLTVREQFGEGGHRRAIKQLIERVRRTSDPRPGGLPGRFLRIEDVPPAERQAFALAAAASFYDRTDDPWDDATATAPAPEPVAPEFHSFVARCADYPELLRHLGLAIDLAIPDDGGIPEFTGIRVASGFNVDLLEELITPPAAPEQARPVTLTHRTDRVWAPDSRTELPDIVDGSLVIDDARRFLVDQLDPDGAALKVTTLLADLERTDQALRDSAQANNNAPSMTADASSLPALRSTGVIVARRDRAAGMVAQFDASADHDQTRTGGQAARLNAADVTRGWRIDVQDEASGSREWFSLHRRAGEYELVAPGADPTPLDVQPKPDEGYLKAASMSSGKADPTADQYLHETLAGWDGWSLAVKRPGRVVNETEAADPSVPPEVADTGFPLAARFRVQRGSLPRLRFGRPYRFRVRAVDLSGRSIPADQLDEARERDLGRTYQRWEPVPSPAVVPLTEYTEGESLMRMVIRSTLDVPVADYIALDRVANLPGHAADGDLGIVYRAENERNLAAPIGSVQLAETHGMFDAALAGDAAAVAAQFAIAGREAGSFLTLPGARVVNPRGPADALTGEKDQVLPDGQYIVHTDRSLSLPYLPDPLARGISFTTLPGDEGGGPAVEGDPPTRLLRWPGDPADWTDRRPVLIRVVEGDGDPEFDADARVLTVRLPKATLRTVRLSSFLDDGDIDLMRVWHLIDEHQAPASSAQLDTVRRGRHWMITPATELTLVHAVEKPLEPPEIRLQPGRMRDRDATFSLLPGVVHNHAPSTGRLDIDAKWADPVDDVLEPAPRDETKRAHVADFQLEAFEVDAQMWAVNGPAAGPYGPRHAVRHEFGDTRHRWVEYTPQATTRFREYFPPKITDDPQLITSVGEPLTVDVPSSSRPAPPDVKYLVPYWEWRTEELGLDAPLAVRRVRTAGGLRVYLGRPWFSSGPDELLGVVLARQPFIRWPVDIDRGVFVDSATRGASEAWAEQVVEGAGIRAVEGIGAGADAAASALVADHIASAAAAVREEAFRARGDRAIRARNDVDRFVVATDRSVTAARLIDRDRVSAVETDVAAGLVTDFSPFFTGTGPEGRRFTSVWGADPIFAGDPVPSGPFATHFPRRVAVGTVALAEVPDTVTVVGHQPDFDADRKLWYCDVAIEAGSAYTPFVQLALARYQPHSIGGVEISTVVRADWLQPLPRREATFVSTPDGAAVLLTVAGTVGIPEHARGLPDLASEISASRRVEAWVERLPADATSDLDWVQVGGPVVLEVRMGLAAIRQERFAEAEWVGAVPLPERIAGERLRVQLAEYELHEGDPIGLSPFIVMLPQRGRRIVYGDSVEVP